MFSIFNETDRDIAELKVLDEYVKYVVKKLALEKCEFNIIIIDNDRIHEINKDYRGIDRETDVISFALEDRKDVEYDNFRLLGDIYISHDRVITQAKEYGHSELREICFLATHGILHLLGYDHMEPEGEKKMFDLQNKLLDEYNIKRDWNERRIK